MVALASSGLKCGGIAENPMRHERVASPGAGSIGPSSSLLHAHHASSANVSHLPPARIQIRSASYESRRHPRLLNILTQRRTEDAQWTPALNRIRRDIDGST